MKKLPESVVQAIILVLFALIVINTAMVQDRTEAVRNVVALIILIILLLMNQLFGEMEEPPRKYRPETEDLFYRALLGKHILIEYTPGRRNEEVIRDIIGYAKDRTSIALVSPMPKSEVYLQAYLEDVEKGDVRLVELSALGEASTGGNPMRIPYQNLDMLEGVLTGLSKGSVVIFDSLTDIVTNVGSKETHMLLRKWLETCGQAEVRVMGFLNPEAHPKRVVSALEDLFLGVAAIRNGRLRKVR